MSVIEMLNDKQQEAATHIEGPLLILAGAGSGKTRVLTNRTAYMIDELGINPWNILAITFTNKAAGEMRERIDRMVGYGADIVWVATFHSTCVRILRRHINLLGYDTNFTIYDTDDQKTLMKEVVKRLQINTKQFSERGLLNRISSAKNELLTPVEEKINASGNYADEIYAKVYEDYQASLKSNNALDFDDLIMKTVELFKAFPEVLDSYQERFRYIMVDEYQDTNTAQFELIRLLAGKYRNICVVGDDDQSIYKFRGANIRNILDFEKVYPDAKIVKLEQNYRSTQTVLDAANSVIANNIGRKSKALWTDRGEGELIRFRQLDSAFEEAEYIVDMICHDRRSGKSEYRDNAVLYRTNAQSRILEEKCVMAGVPYTIVGGVNFYARKEIKDILAYLKTIDNGRDDLAVKRIINVPKRGIGATTLNKMQEYADVNEISLLDALTRAENVLGHGKAADKIGEFVEMISVFRAKAAVMSIEQLTDDVLEVTKYIDMLNELDPEEANDRKENIEEFKNKIIAFSDSLDEEPTLSQFLEEVALVADIDSVEADDNKVLLMTLHSAKGLEFPNVYLSGMEDGLFPSYMSITSNDASEIEEERRLCYVGITRAMNRLTITAAKSRMIRGETQYNALSRFVKEIPTELFEGNVSFEKKRRDDFDDWGGDYSSGFGLGGFGSGSFGGGSNNSAAFGRVSGNGGNSITNTNGSTPAGGRMRPAAIPRKRATTDKPFIATAASAVKLTKGADLGGSAPEYSVGDRVRHIKFGDGTVLSIEKQPKDYEVSVEFDTAGVKRMMAGFARLKKI